MLEGGMRNERRHFILSLSQKVRPSGAPQNEIFSVETSVPTTISYRRHPWALKILIRERIHGRTDLIR